MYALIQGNAGIFQGMRLLRAVDLFTQLINSKRSTRVCAYIDKKTVTHRYQTLQLHGGPIAVANEVGQVIEASKCMHRARETHSVKAWYDETMGSHKLLR